MTWLILSLHLASLPPHYISPTGSDSSDGLSPSTAWATLPHAISALRELRPSTPGPEDRTSLFLLEGRHYLSEMVTLGLQDSYLEVAAISDQATVSISGGQAINVPWNTVGSVKTAEFTGKCAELFLDTYR